jgi:hypothetical protein
MVDLTAAANAALAEPLVPVEQQEPTAEALADDPHD